jgi:hypothetical protein
MSVCLVIDQSSKELGKHLQTPTLIGCIFLKNPPKSAVIPPNSTTHLDRWTAAPDFLQTYLFAVFSAAKPSTVTPFWNLDEPHTKKDKNLSKNWAAFTCWGKLALNAHRLTDTRENAANPEQDAWP